MTPLSNSKMVKAAPGRRTPKRLRRTAQEKFIFEAVPERLVAHPVTRENIRGRDRGRNRYRNAAAGVDPDPDPDSDPEDLWM